MVRFYLEGLRVHFPYDYIYPEQYAYMLLLKRILDAQGHGVLEMPTGTGKTVALFSLITSYQMAHKETGKLIYCTRTVPEMEKALLELKRVVEYRVQDLEQEEALFPAKNGENTEKTTDLSGKTAEEEGKSNEDGAKGGKQSETRSAEDVIGASIKAPGFPGHILGVGLSARRNMCIHPDVAHLADREKVDEHCRKLTAPWIRQKLLGAGRAPPPSPGSDSENPSEEERPPVHSPDIEDLASSTEQGIPRGLCPFYENFERHWTSQLFGTGVYTIEDIKIRCAEYVHPKLNIKTGLCPYFASRRLLQIANVVVLNYQYILDPKVSKAALLGTGVAHNASLSVYSSREKIFGGTHTTAAGSNGSKEPSIVVFDEAHNIDNVCIEALSVSLNRMTLEAANRNLTKLSEEINRCKQEDKERLSAEYQRLVQGLHQTGELDADIFEHLSSPILPEDVLNEAVPGNIRRAEHFISLMKKTIVYLKGYMKVYEVRSEGPLAFLHNFEQETDIDSKCLKFCYDRLKSLLNTLKVTSIDEFSPLTIVADFCTLAGTYWEGFILICDPYPEATGLYDPLLQLSCLDASLAMRPALQRYQSIILTSGTISPLELYPKLLDFVPVVTESLPMSLDRNCICPLIVSRSSDQVPLSSRFELRSDVSVVQNYGILLIELCKNVPDGVVCFFTSYIYMEQTVASWYELGILASVMEHKLVFIETKDVVATTLALQNFRRACDSGRGAVFFSVARGKVAEGIDFDRHYGRCVVLFGVPFQYTLSRILKARLLFMKERYQIQESEFLTFDAMRQAAQCVGRVIRSKADYGLMVFADARFCRLDKRSKLPPWIQKFLENSNLSLTTETAIGVARNFLKHMSLPYLATQVSRLDQEALSDTKRTWIIIQKALALSSSILGIHSLE